MTSREADVFITRPPNLRSWYNYDRRNPNTLPALHLEHDAGRLELLIRIVYWILIGIVLWIYGIIAFICLFIQWFHILILGCRNEGLSNIAKGYLEYTRACDALYVFHDRQAPGYPAGNGEDLRRVTIAGTWPAMAALF
jgi:hypothetical protein